MPHLRSLQNWHALSEHCCVTDALLAICFRGICRMPSTVCTHADTEAANDASLKMMLDLLPREVGYAVAHSLQNGYNLSPSCSIALKVVFSAHNKLSSL